MTRPLVSILLPTRNRLNNLKRLYESVCDTTSQMPEISVYADEDSESAELAKSLGMVVTLGTHRIMLSDMWNVAYWAATGDILMLCGDDIVFRSKNWDVRVVETFETCPDKIVFVHGDDLAFGGRNSGTHGFLHRTWVELIGYFTPPIFSADYCDTWINYVANQLHRRVFLPDVITEHMHPGVGKAAMDQVYRDGRERVERDRVGEIYERSLPERQRDVELLTKYIVDRWAAIWN